MVEFRQKILQKSVVVECPQMTVAAAGAEDLFQFQPIPLNLWVQMLPVTSEQAKLKVTIRAEVNMFMKAMITKPLQEGVEKLAEMLAMIPY